jgi:hypothetical protein
MMWKTRDDGLLGLSSSSDMLFDADFADCSHFRFDGDAMSLSQHVYPKWREITLTQGRTALSPSSIPHFQF